MDSERDAATPGTHPSVGDLRPRSTTILVVDDRPENLLALEAALAPLEQTVITASSGEEALRLLLKHQVAVIILDVQMPGLDGFQTAAYIKKLDRTKDIPIIFLTAISKDSDHVFRGYSAGAVDYLFKPFDAPVLRSKVMVFVDLHQKKQELQASEERFRRAFDHAPIGVALVGLDGTITKTNRALVELTGLQTADLVSKRVNEIVHPEEEPLLVDGSKLADEVARSGGSWHAERRLVTADGNDLYALVSVSFIRDGPNMEPHFIFQITDITARRELESFRERFVSHAAHELRTPATVIAGTALLLHENRDAMSPGEIDRCITALSRQSQRLTTMVGNLLDLSRLKEGRLKADLRVVDLGPLSQHVLDVNPPPENKVVDVAVPSGTLALADAEGMDHILSNLLVNAYRYGGHRITIEAQRRDGHILLSVADNGQGVAEDLVPKLFEPFTRGRFAASVGGSGLGLALVKSLAEVSGGDVAYETTEDAGARFTVKLEAG